MFELEIILCAILLSVCATLVATLAVWRSVSYSLSHLSNEYLAIRHVSITVRQQCDANKLFVCPVD